MVPLKKRSHGSYTSSAAGLTQLVDPAVFSQRSHADFVPLLECMNFIDDVKQVKVAERTFTAPLVKMFMHSSESERAKARFRRLKHLPENHDGEGAAAASSDSIDFALSFLNRVQIARTCLPTLSEEGNAVIEMHNREEGRYADITFIIEEGGMLVQCYVGFKNQPSKFVEGELDSAEVRDFLGDAVSVFYD